MRNLSVSSLGRINALPVDSCSLVLAASEVRRDQVLGNAQSLAARFNDLSGQLDAFDLESTEALEAKVGELNVLLERLGQINGKLQKVKDLSKQPADLLDLRDQVLRDVSELV